MGGAGNCTGTLEVKHQGDWRPADGSDWNPKSSAAVCRQLDCGSDVSTQRSSGSTGEPVWKIPSSYVVSSLRECGIKSSQYSIKRLEVICSGNDNGPH